MAFFISAAISFSSDRFTQLCNEAAALSQQGHYDEAIHKYKAALAIRPSSPQALNNLAVMYYSAHRYADALTTAARVWPAHREMKSAALILGMAAVQCNRPKTALPPLENLVADDPRNRDATLALASAHMALGDLQKSASIYETWTRISPADADAWYGLAICYEQLAENASRELSKAPGGAAYSKQLLGVYLHGLGDQKLADEAFGSAATLSAQQSAPPAAAQLFQQARTFAERSEKSFESFVNLAPDSWQAALFFGDVNRQHGDLTAALTSYQKAAALRPDIAAPVLGIGTVYWELGQYDPAQKYLEDALKRNPNALQAVFELGNIAVRQHRDNGAIPLLARYLDSQPDALAARADLGRAYLHLAQYQKAANELSAAAPSDERGDIHYQLSLALRKLGRTAEADAALLKSTQIKTEELERERRLRAQE